MFQVTRGASSDALLRLWSRSAPRPSGTVIASDIFASGLISSDTDHRIWRDVGDAPGFDFAFLEKTRDYHTPRDALRNVRSGTAQAVGENLLAFVRAFSLKPPERGGKAAAIKTTTTPASASTRSGRTDPGGPGRRRGRADRPRRGRKEPARRGSRLRASYYVVFSAPGPAVARLFYALGAFARRSRARRGSRSRVRTGTPWTSFARRSRRRWRARGSWEAGSPRRSRGASASSSRGNSRATFRARRGRTSPRSSRVRSRPRRLRRSGSWL